MGIIDKIVSRLKTEQQEKVINSHSQNETDQPTQQPELGQKTTQKTPNPNPQPTLMGNNNVETCSNVIKELKNILRIYQGVEGRHELRVNIPDSAIYRALTAGGLEQSLTAELAQSGFNTTVKLISGEPSSDKKLSLIKDTFYYEVVPIEQSQSRYQHIQLSVYENCGRMLEESYTFPCEEGRVYNIGRAGKSNWINDIAFNPDPQDELYKNYTGYVRSKHGYIKVFGGKFYLQAYPDGTKANMSRTQIEHPITHSIDEVTEFGPRELKNGDIIILGKSAKLMVKLE